MKRTVSFLLAMYLLLTAGITASAEDVSIPDEELSTEDILEGGVGETLPSSRPVWDILQNVSMSFYILAGKADVFYTVSSSSPKITVTVEIYKNGLFPKKISEKTFPSVNRKYVSGSLSVPVTEDGTYTVKLTVTSGGDRHVMKRECSYRAADYIGDVNYNGQIQADDARKVLRYAAKLDRMNADMKKVCDVDCNGHVNAADARIVLRRAAKL